MLGGGGLHTGRRAAAAWLDTAEAYVRIPQCPAPVPGGPRRGADTRDTAVGSLGDTCYVAVCRTVWQCHWIVGLSCVVVLQ